MAEKIYTIRGQIHCFPGKEVTREKYDEAVRRINLMAESSGEVSYNVQNSEFSGDSFTYDGASIDIGKARNQHTSKGKEVDLIRVSCSDERLNGIEILLFSG